MDPVTITLAGALVALGNSAIEESGRKLVGEAFDQLKGVLKRKFGHQHEAPQLIETLERLPPGSPDAQVTLTRIDRLQLSQDPDVRAASDRLKEATMQLSVGGVHIGKVEKGIGVNIGNPTFNFGSDTE